MQARAWLSKVLTRETLAVFALGQVLSLFNSGTGVTSQALATNYKVNIPIAQTFLNYFLLAIVYIPVVLCTRTFARGTIRFPDPTSSPTVLVINDSSHTSSKQPTASRHHHRHHHCHHRHQQPDAEADDLAASSEESTSLLPHTRSQAPSPHTGVAGPTPQLTAVRPNIQVAWSLQAFCRHVLWKYAVIAVLDVEANYVAVLAYQYTNLTSIQLLDSFTIPTVMLFSRLLLKHSFVRGQYFGATLCVLGIIIIVVDSFFESDQGGSNQALGDALILIASVLYAASNTAQEYMLQDRPAIEFLAGLGFFGAIINGIQWCVVFATQHLFHSHSRLSRSLPVLLPAPLCIVRFGLRHERPHRHDSLPRVLCQGRN